ncbi:MAG: hypothetical protein V3S09_04705 [Candidatus Bathyarchaeia archaeon]
MSDEEKTEAATAPEEAVEEEADAPVEGAAEGADEEKVPEEEDKAG